MNGVRTCRVRVREAPEPSDVFWANLELSELVWVRVRVRVRAALTLTLNLTLTSSSASAARGATSRPPIAGPAILVGLGLG